MLPLLILITPLRVALADTRTYHPIGIFAESGTGNVASGSSINSINLGINIAEVVRLNFGTGMTLSPFALGVNSGKESNSSTGYYLGGLNGGADYFFSTNDLSLFVGGDVAFTMSSHPTGVQTENVLAEAGVDWSTSVGFNLGVKIIAPLSSLTTPELYIFYGWYF